MRWMLGTMVTLAVACSAGGCGTGDDVAHVSIKNDFNNPAVPSQPPWTICKSSYHGVEFGKVAIGATSAEQQVTPGLDYVLMVAAWSDPSCDPAHLLPIASKSEEEVVPGQHRTIVIGLGSHQGPCPPEGVAPMPAQLYERILALWPEYSFKPYVDRAQNPQCKK